MGMTGSFFAALGAGEPGVAAPGAAGAPGAAVGTGLPLVCRMTGFGADEGAGAPEGVDPPGAGAVARSATLHPHSGQKRAPSLKDAPQLGQNMVAPFQVLG